MDKAIHKLDLFARPISLEFDGDKYYRSSVGLCASIIIIGVMVA
jgi:hypothetical protein